MGFKAETISQFIPEVAHPTQKRLAFNEKLKWTGMVLVTFFVLGLIPLVGLGRNELERFDYLSIILGAEFGSLISLGIGPMVTASIVLQLLNGSGLVNFNLQTPEGKKSFQATQKLLSVFFIIFEACIYVFAGGLSPDPALAGTSLYSGLQIFLIIQLFIGGMLIMFMDEVSTKWGFGSGLSLFIAAGVSKEIFVKAFSPFVDAGVLGIPFGDTPPIGALWQVIWGAINTEPQIAMLGLAAIGATIVVFCLSIYAQAMKIEIPLSFGRVRGQGVRWPLSFIYTSNIPVILVAALLANLQLWGRLLQQAVTDNQGGILYWISHNIVGQFDINGTAQSGIVAYLFPPNLLRMIIEQGTILIGGKPYIQSLVYMLFLIGGSILFSIFWVKTSGMDSRSQAKNIMSSGLTIPGFRSDPRIMERLLDRYIGPLTVMGAITVGFLAALADLLGALSRGTGILLAVMIIYQFYENIAKQHMMDMNPMLRKMME